MSLTLDQLQALAPKAGVKFLPHLIAAMKRFNITTLADRQMFLAIILQESGGLTLLEEGMNYSAERLRQVWPKRFTAEQAAKYARKPEAIANYVYAGRGGNGDEQSGDGWRYRGAGAIQLTFKANQQACAKYFGKQMAEMYAWLRSPEGACMSAAWYWWNRGVSDFAHVGDFDGVCDVVNLGRKTTAYGDAEGFAARLAMLNKIKTIVKE